MSKDRVIKTLTLAMRAANEMTTEMKKALDQSTCSCPVCTAHRSFTQNDLGRLEEQRRSLIEASRSSNNQSELVAHTTITYVSMLQSKLAESVTLCNQSHLAQEILLRLRMAAVAIGNGTTPDKEMMRRAIETVPEGPERDRMREMFDSMPEGVFDPSKAN